MNHHAHVLSRDISPNFNDIVHGDLRRLPIAAACLLILSSAAEARCKETDWTLYTGVTQIEARYTVEKGSACKTTIRGGSEKNGGRLDNFRISRSPAHGNAGVSNSLADHGYAYKPASGFVGTDSFEVTLDRHFLWEENPETAKIIVNVDVVEKF